MKQKFSNLLSLADVFNSTFFDEKILYNAIVLKYTIIGETSDVTSKSSP